MDGKLRWGILSTGRIAKTFAKGLSQSKTGQLVALGSRSREADSALPSPPQPGRGLGTG